VDVIANTPDAKFTDARQKAMGPNIKAASRLDSTIFKAVPDWKLKIKDKTLRADIRIRQEESLPLLVRKFKPG